MSKKLEQAKGILQSIISDHSVPKNIRRAAKDAYRGLDESDDPPSVRASMGIGILDEISQDPNCPTYARTRIWNVVSVLETVKDDEGDEESESEWD